MKTFRAFTKQPAVLLQRLAIVMTLAFSGLAPVLITTGSAAADTPVNLSGWTVDRTAPSGGYNTAGQAPDGSAALDIGVTPPSGASSSFYQYEGLKQDVAATQNISAKLWLDSSWSDHTRVSLWGGGYDAGNAPSSYPVLEYNTDPNLSATGWRIFDSSDAVNGWRDVTVPAADYSLDAWNTIQMVIEPSDSTLTDIYLNGHLIGESVGDATTHFGTIYLQDYDYNSIEGAGPHYDIYWKDITTGIAPTIVSVDAAYTAVSAHAAGLTLGYNAFTSIQAAINAVALGGTVTLNSDITATGSTTIARSVTLDGNGYTLSTSGTVQTLTITGSNVTVKNLHIVKTDNTGAQNLIGIQGDNVTIQDNTFTGQFVIPATGATSRGIVTSAGATGLVITGNSFTNLRQPAYLNNNSGGTISGNYVSGTRGWVVEKASDFAFLSNTWGSNTDGTKALDIAIIAGSSPETTDNNYTCQLAALTLANNGAKVEDQYPAVTPCANTTPTVEIPVDTTTPVDITVDDTTTATVKLDVSGGSASSVIATVPTTLTVSAPKVTVEIPAMTSVTGATGWDGTITLPTATTAVNTGTGTTLGTAITIGSSTTKLTFDQYVKLVFPGQAGKSAGYQEPGGAFTEITDACSSATGAPTAGVNECKVDSGSDLVIWTNHFTTFATFTAAPTYPAGDTSTTASSSNGSDTKHSVVVASADTSSASATDNSAVKGTSAGTSSTSTTNKAATTNGSAKKSSNFLGLGWWWVPILVVVAAAAAWGVNRYVNGTETNA